MLVYQRVNWNDTDGGSTVLHRLLMFFLPNNIKQPEGHDQQQMEIAATQINWIETKSKNIGIEWIANFAILDFCLRTLGSKKKEPQSLKLSSESCQNNLADRGQGAIICTAARLSCGLMDGTWTQAGFSQRCGITWEITWGNHVLTALVMS